MRQKNVSIIVQYNTVWFRQIQPKTERKPRATPFYIVSFRSCVVSFRSVSCAESKSRLFPVGDSQARWSTLCFPQTHFRAFGRLHATRRSLGDAFFKSGRSPQIANRSRVRRSLLAWHSRRRLNKMKRNRTKRNETIL